MKKKKKLECLKVSIVCNCNWKKTLDVLQKRFKTNSTSYTQ